MVTLSSQHATARHGNERRNTPLDALLAEWHRLGPTIETGLVGQRFTGPNIAADLICHGADLHETLHLGRTDRAHWHDPFLEVYDAPPRSTTARRRNTDRARRTRHPMALRRR